MSVIDQLSSTQGQKGNDANIALAKKIASSDDKNAVKELADNLKNKDKRIASDCIKTIYETGYIKPELIADYCSDFIELLNSKNNRLVWGGMTALTTIADIKHKEIFDSLDTVMEAVDKGSVITIDGGVDVLAKLNKHDGYFNTTDPLLIDQLWKCPIKQLPMYIERALVSISTRNKEIYLSIIEKRKTECTNGSQVKRLEKALKQINAIS
jgi:hypothetical protein